MAVGVNYKPKRLLGIATNDALLKIWKEAYHDNKNCTSSSKLKSKSNSDDTAADADIDAVISSPTNESEAIDILQRVGDPSKKKKSNSTTIVMPIRVVQALQLLCAREEETTQVESLVEQLALSPTKTTTTSNLEAFQQALEEPRTPVLVFTPPPEEPALTPSRKKYLLRREKLKLLAEETKYNKITINLQDQRQEDDVTAKSMTYAASVGLNMIVAPISFGTFMFFFSGGVFDYFFPKVADEYSRNTNHNPVDIKRVIIGVVSGVIMMIIEMVLFVIRTHEFDHYATKKKKARGVEPFGAYTSKSIKEYYEDENHNKINNTTPVATTNTNTSISTNDVVVVDKEKKNS